MEETREKATLKEELKQLHSLNQQLSVDAHNLASALKGQSKVQGDWGELQLETLLEKSGLQKGIHFLSQATFRDEDGAAKRPDFIIQLPDNKQLIVDSKVSLSAFERYFNAEDASTTRPTPARARSQLAQPRGQPEPHQLPNPLPNQYPRLPHPVCTARQRAQYRGTSRSSNCTPMRWSEILSWSAPVP